MAKTQQKLTKTVFCPVCGTSMKKATTKPHQHRADEDTGVILLVTRVFYGCPNDQCRTVIWFDFREDGRRGRLSRVLEVQKKLEKKGAFDPGGLYLGGGFKDMQ
jgi:hypothetical protein